MRVTMEKGETVQETERIWPGVCSPKPRIVTYNRAKTETGQFYLERSDITPVMADEAGFRKPSPYQSTMREWKLPKIDGRYYNASGTECGSYRTNQQVLSDAFNYVTLPSQVTSVLLDGTLSNVKPEQQLINNAFSALKDQRLHLGMTLAFAGQTSTMITDMATRLRLSYSALKRGNLRKARKELGEAYTKLKRSQNRSKFEELRKIHKLSSADKAADLYLEVLFGWLQLSRDLQGAYEEMNRKSRPKMFYVYGRARDSNTRKHNQLCTVGIKSSGRPLIRAVGEVKSEVRVVVIARVSHSGLHRASQLGLIDPLELVWDYARFSWIIDQFVHVAGYLSAYNATAGLTYLGGSLTRYKKTELTLTNEMNVQWNLWEPSSATAGFARAVISNRRVINESDVGVAIRNPFQANTAVAAAAVMTLIKTLRGGGPIPRYSNRFNRRG